MKTVIHVVAVLLFVCQTLSIYGQGASVAIDKDRKAWLGFNVGGFWQGSDIRPASSAGSSLIFDYYFIRNNTSVFGIGVRGQYLKATSLGLGITRDYNIQSNPSLNGSSGNPDYASLGSGKDYVFQNYSTDITDFSGNVIISLNRLRAVSRINLYVFGGIGGTGYIASMNQRDAAGNLYDYDLINSSGQKSEIKKELKALRDDTYETYGEGGSSRSWAFTPTVGAGFGIQLSSRVQLALEHKVGFTGTDLLDGNRYGNSNSRNDIYHYSSFGINFGVGKLIGGDGSTVTKAPVRRTPVLPVTPTEPTVNLPTIRITSPASSSVTVEDCSVSITAFVENVTSRQDISVMQDRTPIAFEFSGRRITVSDISFTGTSDFVITAKNSAGIATQSVSFTCQPRVETITICHRETGQNNQTISIPTSEWSLHQAHGDTQGECPVIPLQVQPPVITVSAPATSPITVDDCTASIIATVENINDKQSIAIVRDRTPVAFAFSGNKITVSNINFIGSANFIITAKNTAGTATQTVTFICRPPIRKITICHREAGLSPQSIDIPITEWPTHLSHGDTQGTCPVIQTPAVQPPVVTITLPATSPITLENCKASITAVIGNITSKEGITVTRNQNPVAFEFVNNTVSVSDIDFTDTANFVITATNSAGTTTKTASFVCQPPVEMITICHKAAGQSPQELSIPATAWATHQAHGDTQGACPVVQSPVVTITTPATSLVTVESCKASITATVENITDKEGITVTQNQTAVAFEFANNTVSVSDVDFTGTANFVITATNSAGTATKTASFVCQPPVEMITICHKAAGQSPQELSIPATAWATHQAHGDTQGACPVVQSPTVTISTPATSPITVEDCKASITATVENITDQQDISVTKNGTPITFIFVDNTVSVSNLSFTGTANFVITATNSAGTATKTTSFVCLPKEITICHIPPGNNTNPQTITIAESAWPAHERHGDTKGECPVVQAPIVTVTSPSNSPVTVEDCKASFTATVDNITNKEDITVMQNQTPVTFIFTDNTVTVSNLNITGTANFVIKATNSAGTATKTVSFVCQPKQITICHIPPGNNANPQTITIAESAWPAHQAHGDTQGACPVVQSPTDNDNMSNDNKDESKDKNNDRDKEDKSKEEEGDKSKSGEEDKITICHHPPGNRQNFQTLTIPASAWPAHEKHGDTKGPCKD